MKNVKLSEMITITKPEYVFLKLTPNNSIRNHSTHKIAKSIASIYRNVFQNIKKEEFKLIKVLGKEFLFGTKYSVDMNSKVSFFVYIEKKKVEFFFIIPKQHLSIIKEKITDVWSNITVKEVETLPRFSETAARFQMSYSKEDALSLATNRSNNDLLNSKLNIVDVMEDGDKAGVFYNFIPTSQFTWRSSYENTIRKVKRNLPTDRNKFGVAYGLKMVIGLLSSIVDDIGEVIGGENKRKNNENSINLLEQTLERLNGGKQITESTRRKATATVIDTQIAIFSESENKLRQRNNVRSLAQSFEAISDDNRLTSKRLKAFNYTDYKIKADVNKIGDEEAQNFLSIAGRDILEKYNFIDKVDTQETEVPEDLQAGTMCIGTSTFRGHKQQAFLSSDKEYKNLSLILIGPNRSGKSTLIGNLTRDALNADEAVVLFDFIENCELSEEVAALFPSDQVLEIDCSDPQKAQGLGYNEIHQSSDVFEQYKNAKLQTSQLETLVNSINPDESRLSPKMERYLQSAANIVFLVGGSIKEVFAVLQNHHTRSHFLEKVPSEQYENIGEYMESLRELDEYDKEGAVNGTKLHLVMGIIDRLNKLKANAFMELMLKKDTKDNIDLVEETQKAQLIIVKMPETMFPTDVEKDICSTYWMTKLWLAMQVRADKVRDKSQRRNVNFIIDELYQVENTERFLTDKLSRLPKFRIKPIISCHHLSQIKYIREELRSANASYMLISGCDKKNYNELKSELYPYTEEDLLRLPRYHSLNLIKSKDGYGRFITELPAPIGEYCKEKEDKELLLTKK